MSVASTMSCELVQNTFIFLLKGSSSPPILEDTTLLHNRLSERKLSQLNLLQPDCTEGFFAHVLHIFPLVTLSALHLHFYKVTSMEMVPAIPILPPKAVYCISCHTMDVTLQSCVS